MAVPLLETLELEGKTVTADALNTQRNLADYLVAQRGAHYVFTVKGNQPTLHADLKLFFEDRGAPDHVDVTPPDHGRIEIRRIWVTTALNTCLNFPHVGQAFLIERETINKKTGKVTFELSYGVTDLMPAKADPKRLIEINRGHWCIESHHWMLDWNFDEDRGRISAGHGPENITCFRRFAIGLLKSKGVENIAQKMRQLTMNVRTVFDYLKLTKNAHPAQAAA